MESSGLPIVFLAVFGIIIFISFIITVMALIDIIRSDFKGDNDKIKWLLLTLFITPIGAILYFIIGKKNKVGH
ncbi:MAG: hypothetical protein ACI94Y_004043 [Maribacter sp.]|jgi:hypothetical protein